MVSPNIRSPRFNWQTPNAMHEFLKEQDEQRRKALDAETRGSQWLAKGNEYNERGDKTRAEKCYAKAQFWLDRYNKLTGRA